MHSPISPNAAIPLLAAGIVAIVVSCTGGSEPMSPSAAHVHVAATQPGVPIPDLGRKLAELKASTARYHDFAAAQADG